MDSIGLADEHAECGNLMSRITLEGVRRFERRRFASPSCAKGTLPRRGVPQGQRNFRANASSRAALAAKTVFGQLQCCDHAQVPGWPRTY